MIDMASKSTPPAEDPPLPEDIAGLEEALTQLLAQRASLADALAGHPARERRLLERQAPEAEVGANDVHRRRIAYQLEATERREHELRTALAAARRDARQGVWADFVDEFEECAARLRDRASDLQQAHCDIADVARRAARAGFNEHEHATAHLPFPGSDAFRINYPALRAFGDIVPRLRRVDARAADVTPLVLIRFSAYALVTVGGPLVAYQRGAVAGFDARAAWQLVDRGRAEFVDTHTIPPRPKTAKPAEALP